MKKLQRDVEQAIAATGVTIIERLKVSGHMRFIIRLPTGETRKLTTSSSPRITEHALRAIKKELRAML